MSIITSQSPKKSVVKRAFSIKTTNMHPKIGMLFYVSSLTWWFVAVNPATSGFKTVNMALGFFVLLLNFIIGYQLDVIAAIAIPPNLSAFSLAINRTFDSIEIK